MSAPTEENKKPAGIESFLIVAYRSLRGSKQTSAFGCPKDILNASTKKIEEMVAKAQFVAVEPTKEFLPSRVKNVVNYFVSDAFLFKQNLTKPETQLQLFPNSEVDVEIAATSHVMNSVFLQSTMFDGLTVIIYDCYVVTLDLDNPIVERYYRDETGEIKCETTAIPIKPQRDYFDRHLSFGRSFAQNHKLVYYVSKDGRIVRVKLGRILRITSSQEVYEQGSQNTEPRQVRKYVDFALHNRRSGTLFALSENGTIDYYQGVKKLVYSHSLEGKGQVTAGTETLSEYTTIACDRKFLVVAMNPTETFFCNKLKAFRIRMESNGPRLAYLGEVQYSTDQESENEHNPCHHLVFMYPKRYRILYAQQLFGLGSLFYLDKRGIVKLANILLTYRKYMGLEFGQGGMQWGFGLLPDTADSFFLQTSQSTSIKQIRISLDETPRLSNIYASGRVS